MEMSYVHLHVHSEYSFLYGAGKIDHLVAQAKHLGFPALALTDRNGMYGTVPFYKACKNAGIKPVIGVELTFKKSDGESSSLFQLVLLAKNNKGLQKLMQLTSLAYEQEERGKPIIQFEDLHNIQELIVISPFEGGLVQQRVKEGGLYRADEALVNLQHTFGEINVYIELQQHNRAEEKQLLLDLNEWKKQTTENPRFVASNHVQFVTANQGRAHRVVQAIGRGQTLEELPEIVSSDEYYLKSSQQMKALFEAWPEACKNTEVITEQCNVEIEFGNQVLPKYPVPSDKSAIAFLRERCEEGVVKRFGSVPDKEVWKRLDYELSVINDMHYEDYFLIVWDFMAYAHEMGILTGPGRGSAAGSLVAYALEITDVDPIKYELLFERFLNPERVSMPDIDIDFPDDRRDEVIHYVASKYGACYVAQIITFGTLAAKAAIRDVGKVLSVNQHLIDRVAKLIPSKPNVTLTDALKETPSLKKLVQENDDLQELLSVAMEIEGLPRHTSIHAAGVVISEHKLTEVIPIQTGNDGLKVTQYPMGTLEELGLLKMDFLGLRNLNFMKSIVQLIQEDYQKVVDIKTIPFDDVATFQLLSEGDTSGVFQLESTGMRNVLKRLKPTEFEDIVAVNALYRPGPMENIPVYIRRKHGQEPVTYPHNDLKPILDKTYGVLIYQEQIMQIASKMAGFTLGEADILRRAVGKKKREVLEEARDQFTSGAQKRGYELREANHVYDLIVRFADYGFNRSHAVAYSVIAYQLAYLKANFHTSFLTALLSGVLHHHEKMAEYLSEARKKGIEVKRPSVNDSGARFSASGKTIRIGLKAIKNVGIQSVTAILEERRNGVFKDLFDLCSRIEAKVLPKRALEALIVSGACDDFGIHRAGLLANLDSAIEFGEKARNFIQQNETALFKEDLEKPEYFDVPPFGEQEALSFEKQILGFYASNHPLHPYLDHLTSYDRKSIKLIADDGREGGKVRLAGLVEDVNVIKTKKGDQMAFVILSDETGEMEITFFPKTFEKYRQMVEKDQLVFMEGTIGTHKGQLKIHADKMTSIESVIAKANNEVKSFILYVKIDQNHQDSGYKDRLKRLLQDDPGDVQVVLYDENKKKVYRLPSEWNVSANKNLLSRLEVLLGEKNIILKQE